MAITTKARESLSSPNSEAAPLAPRSSGLKSSSPDSVTSTGGILRKYNVVTTDGRALVVYATDKDSAREVVRQFGAIAQGIRLAGESRS